MDMLQKRLRSREQDLKMLQELMMERDKLRRRSIVSLPRETRDPLGDTGLGSEIDSYFAAASGPPLSASSDKPEVEVVDISTDEIEQALGLGNAPPVSSSTGLATSPIAASGRSAGLQGVGAPSAAPGSAAGGSDTGLRNILLADEGVEGACNAPSFGRQFFSFLQSNIDVLCVLLRLLFGMWLAGHVRHGSGARSWLV